MHSNAEVNSILVKAGLRVNRGKHGLFFELREIICNLMMA